MTILGAAEHVLRKSGPLRIRDMLGKIQDMQLAHLTGSTPERTLASAISKHISGKGSTSKFVRVRKGVYGLRDSSDRPIEVVDEPTDKMERRVCVPLFPVYREVRHLLEVWPGRTRKQITGLESALRELYGNPKQPVDWTEPDAWIDERLSGSNKELASAIWTKSRKTVNPRHTYGHWLFARTYDLVTKGGNELVALTKRGRDFLKHEGGEAELILDEQEGLAALLALVADSGPTRTGGILERWTDYLMGHSSPFSKRSTIKDSLRRRLNNLLDRGLIVRNGTVYSVTDAGLQYLERIVPEPKKPLSDLRRIAKRLVTSSREDLRQVLLAMNPYAFEHLIKRLYEEMQYDAVEVTPSTGDGGVDIIADFTQGISQMREVVQVKRHKQTIQTKDIDALRGCLFKFGAVRGTIVSTSKFASGAKKTAVAKGAPPIALIDGDRLIDLLIEHGIGVGKRTIDLLELRREVFEEIEEDAKSDTSIDT